MTGNTNTYSFNGSKHSVGGAWEPYYYRDARGTLHHVAVCACDVDYVGPFVVIRLHTSTPHDTCDIDIVDTS